MHEIILTTIDRYLQESGLPSLRKKSTRTHGGEWCGPCLRCHRLGAAKNEDRFLVWPSRPVYGNGSYEEPCFTCRRCFDPRYPSAPWSGDLVKFVMEAEHCSFGEAKRLLGIEQDGTTTARIVTLRQSLSSTGAPAAYWQEEGLRFLQEAQQVLWSDAGAYARAYLHKRGLTEETLRAAHIGCVPATHFCSGTPWGREQKLFVPRGIVFPELYALDIHGVPTLELWSLAIRRPDADIVEETVAGKAPAKYHYLAGSQKGLYGFEYRFAAKPVVMVEGQLDQLSVRQACKEQVMAVATLSSRGAQSLHWLTRLARYPLVLLCHDHDEAGQEAVAYWQEVLGQKAFPWVPPTHDISALLQQQGDEGVRSFLAEGIRQATLSSFPLSEATEGLAGEGLVNVATTSQNPQIFILEPNRGISTQEEQYQKEQREHEMAAISLSEATEGLTGQALPVPPPEAHEAFSPISEPSRACTRCASLAVTAQTGEADTCCFWCDACYPALRIMQEGEALHWKPLVCADGTAIAGGFAGYRAYVCTHEIAVLLCGMQRVHDAYMGWDAQDEAMQRRKHGTVTPVQYRCARHPGGCWRDYRRPVRLRYEQEEPGDEPALAVLDTGEEQDPSTALWHRFQAVLRTPVKRGMQTFFCGKHPFEPAGYRARATYIRLVQEAIFAQDDRLVEWGHAEVQRHAETSTQRGLKNWNAPYKYPEETGQQHTIAGEILCWCPVCYPSFLVLELANALHFPAFYAGKTGVEAGFAAWRHFVTHADLYTVVWVHDALRRTYPEVYTKVLDYVIEA